MLSDIVMELTLSSPRISVSIEMYSTSLAWFLAKLAWLSMLFILYLACTVHSVCQLRNWWKERISHVWWKSCQQSRIKFIKHSVEWWVQWYQSCGDIVSSCDAWSGFRAQCQCLTGMQRPSILVWESHYTLASTPRQKTARIEHSYRLKMSRVITDSTLQM